MWLRSFEVDTIWFHLTFWHAFQDTQLKRRILVYFYFLRDITNYERFRRVHFLRTYFLSWKNVRWSVLFHEVLIFLIFFHVWLWFFAFITHSVSPYSQVIVQLRRGQLTWLCVFEPSTIETTNDLLRFILRYLIFSNNDILQEIL